MQQCVWVRVPSGAPQLDTNFDTMGIEAGVQFLFVKAPVYKDFSIPFNESRLYGNREMVAVEPFCVFAYELFNERSGGCA